MIVRIRDVAKLINNKQTNKVLDSTTYVTTENMLPNRGGVEFPVKKLPKNIKKINTYKKGDILISNIRPYFKKIWLADRDGSCSGDVLIFRSANKELLQEFLYLVLQTDNFFEYMTVTSKGTKMPRGDKEAISEFKFNLPNIEVQKDICQKLLLLERKIKLNKEINANLLELSNSIFNELLKSVSKKRKLSDFVDIQNGYAFKSSEYISNGGLVVLRTKNISNNSLFTKSDIQYISNNNYKKYRKFEFRQYDVALVMVGASIGKTGIVTSNVLPALQNQNMWRFRAKDSLVPGLYIYEVVNMINNFVKGSASGSARSFYKKSLFTNFEVPIFNTSDYEVFEKIESKINELACENTILNSIKSSLLTKLLN